jgi:short-subunit dehydrogenase
VRRLDPAAFRTRYGPVAVVAGASEGLGLAFAEELAARGLDLVLVARRAERLGEVAARLAAAHGMSARPIAADLRLAEACDRVVLEADAARVGLLVFDAAYSPIGPFLDVALEDHMRVLDVNCRAPARLAHAFGAAMAARGNGGILLMSSMAGFQGASHVAHYAATKAWNTTLAEGLAEELGPRGVDVLACCAGATRTPGYLASRPSRERAPTMDPRDVAREALDALPRRGSFVPGRANRAAAVFLRLLPRRWAVRIASGETIAMYGKGGDGR